MVEGNDRQHMDKKRALAQGKRESNGQKERKRGQREEINGTWRKTVRGGKEKDDQGKNV